MARLINSELGQFRKPSIDYDGISSNAIKIEKANGDVILFTPHEAKEVLREYITEELELYTDEISRKRKAQIEERINFKLKELENSLVRHVDYKINKITEKIVSLTIDRMVKEEVDKRVSEIMLKLKSNL
jgi:hypothetical protein